MNIKSNLNGLKKLQDNLESLSKTSAVSFLEMFNSAFMQKYTQHQSIDEMFEASGFKVETPEDFEAVPDNEWETFVIKTTQFSSWLEMQRTAGNEWVSQKISKGLK